MEPTTYAITDPKFSRAVALLREPMPRSGVFWWDSDFPRDAVRVANNVAFVRTGNRIEVYARFDPAPRAPILRGVLVGTVKLPAIVDTPLPCIRREGPLPEGANTDDGDFVYWCRHENMVEVRTYIGGGELLEQPGTHTLSGQERCWCWAGSFEADTFTPQHTENSTNDATV